MNIHNLDKIFKPKRIALIGVTSNPNSVGGKVLQNLIGGGFRGVVYPVNPDFEAVLGIQCYPDIKSLPHTPDLGVICTSAGKVPQIVHNCGESGILGIIIISAGFKEIGEKGILLEEQIKDEIKKFKGMRIIGPNCLGIIIPRFKLNVSFANSIPKPGNIAFISQSGALCTSVLDWAMEEKIGFSYFISIGNTIDVDFGDLIDYLGVDDETESILLYIESINNARKFTTAARAFARSKPILAYKAGRFPESAEVAFSHTGAMASEDSVYDAAFQRTGICRVFDSGDILDCAQLIGRRKIPEGPNLGIITNAGGPGVMATDALASLNGHLAKLSEDTMNQLNENLPPFWSHRNPVDVLGDSRSKRISKATKIILNDSNVDAVLVILTPQAMTNPTTTAKELGKIAEGSRKPILAAWFGGKTMQEGLQILINSGIAAYRHPEQAIRAFMKLVEYSRNLKILYETPKNIPVGFEFNREKIHSDFTKNYFKKNEIISEEISKKLLESYSIKTTYPFPASSEEKAVEIAEKIGYPVVLKIDSPEITHKSDIGGVALFLNNKSIVKKSFAKIISNAKKNKPKAKINGVTVQKMINEKTGIELIIGIKKDPVFGTVIMVGAGGIQTEILADRALGFPPLNERLARLMLESLKIYPLLKGFRGKPPINMNFLIQTIIRLSYLAADFPEIKGLDINPLLVNQKEIIALDARIVIDKKIITKQIKTYSHLVLKPYPEEYVNKAKLNDGREILLRPIKPEDEPLWLDLLKSCSKESIFSRFRYFFHWETHEVATKFCYIDYDREIAIVAEIQENNNKKLIGVGRLVSDPDHESVEYAVLIADKWQHKELGGILTDYCMDIAKKWKMKKIEAITTMDNYRMIAVFKKRGFTLNYNSSNTEVDVVKEIN
jgi:acetyltransferase